MTDRISREKRSQVMSAVRGKGSKLERVLAVALASAGLRLRPQPSGIPGRPDFASKKRMLAVFVDSCFWHGCPRHLRMPASNVAYWEAKVARNRQRDRAVTRALRAEGWRVVRIWEHQLATPALVARQARRVARALEATP